jgi:hypothetical protein
VREGRIVKLLLQGPHFLSDRPDNELIERNALLCGLGFCLLLELGGEIQGIPCHGDVLF